MIHWGLPSISVSIKILGASLSWVHIKRKGIIMCHPATPKEWCSYWMNENLLVLCIVEKNILLIQHLIQPQLKNYNTDKQGNDFLDFCDRLDNNRNLKRCFCHSDLGGGFTWPVGQTEASQGGANHTLCHTGANHTVCKAKPCLNISDTKGNQDAWKECVLGQRTTFDCMNANHVSSIFSVQSTVRIISQNYEVE